MDGERFDRITRDLTGDPRSRRRLLGGLAGGALAALLGRAAAAQDASGDGERRPAGRCLGEKKGCRRDAQCCSGRCVGTYGKKKCRPAPGQGTCTTDRNVCDVGPDAARGCNGDPACTCTVTTRGTAYCAGLPTCQACATNADCLAAGFPVGSACVSLAGGVCAADGFCGGAPTTCVPPCGVAPPAPAGEPPAPPREADVEP